MRQPLVRYLVDGRRKTVDDRLLVACGLSSKSTPICDTLLVDFERTMRQASEGYVILGLIGMSGAGKSAWAQKLADAGWSWLHCDQLIAEKLGARSEVAAGAVHDLGNWMGLPHEAGYAEREAIYLQYENEVLREIIQAVSNHSAPARDIIIDLTGSAIYVDRELLDRLRSLATIVYLAVSPKLHRQMLHDYLAHPRPIVWNTNYQPLPGEVPAATLARCYPRLVAAREQQYREISDVILDETLHRDPAFDVDALLRYVEQQRPRKQHES